MVERIRTEMLQSAYGRKKVLTDVTIQADAGECIGIIGNNGCGKTTLLDILSGIRKPAAGQIFFDGTLPGTLSNIRRYTAYVPQNNNLMEELTVWDNLLFWYPDRESAEKAMSVGLLQKLGIEQFAGKKVSRLSGGMKKKASIACALAGNAPVLILDEPGTALDLAAKTEVRAYLNYFKEQGGCILIATHEEADLELCDRIYMLKNGKAEQIDLNMRGIALMNLLLVD